MTKQEEGTMTKVRFEPGDWVEVNMAYSVGIDRLPPNWQPAQILETEAEHPTFGAHYMGHVCHVPARSNPKAVIETKNIRYLKDLAAVGLGPNALVRITKPVPGLKGLAGQGPWRVLGTGGFDGMGGKQYLALDWAGTGPAPGRHLDGLNCKASLLVPWAPAEYEPFALQATVMDDEQDDETFNFLSLLEAHKADPEALTALAVAAEQAAAAYAGGLDRDEVRANVAPVGYDAGIDGRKKVVCW